MVKITASLCLLAACVDTDVGGPPYRVEVLALVGVDPETGSGNYALAPVELPDLQSLTPLRDPGFHFIAEPAIDLVALNALTDAEQVSYPRRDADYSPRVRDEGGVAVARDLDSLQVLSAYHAFREVVAMLPELTGADASAIVPDQGFEVWVKPREDGGFITEQESMNAFYMPLLEGFGLVAIDPVEKLPIGAVLPVLAHEFGHHLFARSFGGADGLCDPNDTGPSPPGRFRHEPAMRGVNEGFGGLVSFAVTGVSNTAGDVLPFADIGNRAVDIRKPNAIVFRYNDGTCGGFYCIGTLFARSQVEAALLRGEDLDDRAVRMTLARHAYAALTEVPALLRQIAAAREWPHAYACEGTPNIYRTIMSAFIGAFITALPEASRASACARFIENFGEDGFQTEDRSVCQ